RHPKSALRQGNEVRTKTKHHLPQKLPPLPRRRSLPQDRQRTWKINRASRPDDNQIDASKLERGHPARLYKSENFTSNNMPRKQTLADRMPALRLKQPPKGGTQN